MTIKRTFPLSFTFCEQKSYGIQSHAKNSDAGLNKFDELEGLDWERQSADGCQIKAPLATESAGPNPTDRGKTGTKISDLAEGHDVPLSIVVSGANRHDSVRLEPLLADRFEPAESDSENVLNLCLDAGYVGPSFQIPIFALTFGSSSRSIRG